MSAFIEDDAQRILAAAENTIANGIHSVDSLVNLLELLRILSLEDVDLHALTIRLLQHNRSLLVILANKFTLDVLADMLVHPGQLYPSRDESVAGLKVRLQAYIDDWQASLTAQEQAE